MSFFPFQQFASVLLDEARITDGTSVGQMSGKIKLQDLIEILLYREKQEVMKPVGGIGWMKSGPQ
jgi:hypothetical protein